MALLQILKFPDPRLKLVAEPVLQFDEALMALVSDMQETMYEFDGIGIAATQVNVNKRIFIVDLSETKDQGLCFINPVITSKSGESIQDEGCLSFPGVWAKVKRASEVTVEYYNLQGVKQELHADGWLAICIQHELDHLNGITFFDHLSSLKQKLLRAKLRDKIS